MSKESFKDLIKRLERGGSITLKINIYLDGDNYCAIFDDFFKNLEQSPSGFDDTFFGAIRELISDFENNKKKYLDKVI